MTEFTEIVPGNRAL